MKTYKSVSAHSFHGIIAFEKVVVTNTPLVDEW